MARRKNIYKEITIQSWEQFDQELNNMPYRQWIYRGHTDESWKLKTSLYRLFEDIQEIYRKSKGRTRKFAKDNHEKLLIDRFKSNAHLYLRHLPNKNDNLEWLALMQHNGAPTRLLDVTLSPHIACYFAIETGHSDSCIYAFNHKEISNYNKEELDINNTNYKDQLFKNLKREKSFIALYLPKMSSERLLAQQGLFLVPSNNYETFENLLKYYNLSGDGYIKFIIPASLRYKGLERLRDMNITTSSLFPGLDGFCRSMRYQVLETTQNLKAIY